MEQVNLDGGRFIREAKVSLYPARLLSVWGFVFAVSPTSLHPLPNKTFLFLLFADEYFSFNKLRLIDYVCQKELLRILEQFNNNWNNLNVILCN